VRGFARAGADVVIVSRKLESCVALAEEVTAETGRRAVPYSCHVGSWDDVGVLVDTVYDQFSRIDVLVNNAGLAPSDTNLSEVGEDLFDKVMAVNLKAVYRLTALVGTRMAEGAGGSIVNVSSMAAVRPQPDSIAYAAAKAGVNALTVAFARRFGPTVRVNAIMPGPFLTDMSRAWDLEAFRARAARFALGRGGDPDEIVGAALYLASPAASFTTGAVIAVDGGSVG
jgi:NAD(P)-dependent dehydrogenase (short-subunit alcohol dehydrogenase family)